MYFQEERKKTIEKYHRGEAQDDFQLPPGKDPSEALFQAVSRTVANRWKAMPDVERKPFYDRALAEMGIYRKKMEEYNQKMIDSSSLAQRLAETQREQLAESKLLTEQLERERMARITGGESKPLAAGASPTTTSAAGAEPQTGQQVGSLRPLLDNVPGDNRAMMLTSRLQGPASSTTFSDQQQQQQQQAALQQLLGESWYQQPPTSSSLAQDLSNFVGGASYNNNNMNPSASVQFATQFTGINQQGNDLAALLQMQQAQLLAQQQQRTQMQSLESLLQELSRGDQLHATSLQSPHQSAGISNQSSQSENDTLMRLLQLGQLQQQQQQQMFGLPSMPSHQQQQQPLPNDLGQLLQERPELIQLLQAQQQPHAAGASEESKLEQELRRLSRRNP